MMVTRHLTSLVFSNTWRKHKKPALASVHKCKGAAEGITCPIMA
jgi:hypothetical protein